MPEQNHIPHTGIFVDDWWGIYAPARAINVAYALGAPIPPSTIALANQDLASSADNPNATDPITLEEHDTLTHDLEAAEEWLNTHRAWPGRTSWGWDEGRWGHTVSVPYGDHPRLFFYADIYHHDTNPTGPEDAVDSGYFDPDYSAWWPIGEDPDTDGWCVDLLPLLEGNYHPDTFALLVADRIRRWTGTVDHTDTSQTTLVAHATEAVDDLAGSRGQPLASHWAMRHAEVTGLTPDEIDRIAHLLTSHP